MKLLNFQKNGKEYFGAVINNRAVSFEELVRNEGNAASALENLEQYLMNLPGSFEQASEKLSAVDSQSSPGYPLDQVRILPSVPRPAALLDFGLTPKHLIQSAATMMKHEFGPFFGRLVYSLMKRRIRRASQADEPLYYKGNHLSVIGDNDVMGWPCYTSYLDIEPELAVVTGNSKYKIAGYTSFYAASARDVQCSEMMGSGPARSKDFEAGNGLGPFLVTPDEIADPLSLKVKVCIGDRYVWQGNTAEYIAHPLKIAEYYETISPLQPGTVIGMGTIPDCTGLDNDLWLLPGEAV